LRADASTSTATPPAYRDDRETPLNPWAGMIYRYDISEFRSIGIFFEAILDIGRTIGGVSPHEQRNHDGRM
jgi:hypothetical protein